MKEFKINEHQVQKLGSILLNYPAKEVLEAIDILRNLPILELIEDNQN